MFFDEPAYPVIDKAPRFWKTGATAAAYNSFVYQLYKQAVLIQLATSAGRTGQHSQEPVLPAIRSVGQLVSVLLLSSCLAC